MAVNYASVIANLETRILAASAELAAITTSKPDYGIDGQSVQNQGRIKALNESILEMQRTINLLSPYILTSRVRT